tara:strand:- start:246 stop:638 length:393 start_codon:yes stop_codon:yes gene_type:complete
MIFSKRRKTKEALSNKAQEKAEKEEKAKEKAKQDSAKVYGEMMQAMKRELQTQAVPVPKAVAKRYAEEAKKFSFENKPDSDQLRSSAIQAIGGESEEGLKGRELRRTKRKNTKALIDYAKQEKKEKKEKK